MKHFAKTALLAATFTSVPMICRAADAKPAPAPNLIANGDFESWAPLPSADPKRTPHLPDGLAPTGWTPSQESYERSQNPDAVVQGTVEQDKAVKHGGDSAVCIEGGLPTDIVEVGLPPFKIEPNTRYVVEGWVRAQGVQLNAKDGTGIGVWTSFGPTDFWAHQTSTFNQPVPKDGTFDWTHFEIPVQSGPNAALFRLILQIRRASGKVWFDDVEVVSGGKVQPVINF